MKEGDVGGKWETRNGKHTAAAATAAATAAAAAAVAAAAVNNAVVVGIAGNFANGIAAVARCSREGRHEPAQPPIAEWPRRGGGRVALEAGAGGGLEEKLQAAGGAGEQEAGEVREVRVVADE